MILAFGTNKEGKVIAKGKEIWVETHSILPRMESVSLPMGSVKKRKRRRAAIGDGDADDQKEERTCGLVCAEDGSSR
jgi:hypothetical protein